MQAVQKFDRAFDIPFAHFVVDRERQDLFCCAFGGRAHSLAIAEFRGFRIGVGVDGRNEPVAEFDPVLTRLLQDSSFLRH